MKIGIVTDNTANLDNNYIEKNDIGVVSLYINNKDSFYKATDKEVEDFYMGIKDTDYIPKTSQPSIKDFEKMYSEMLGEYDKIISLHISSDLSGTYNSAKIASNMVEEGEVIVLETKLTTWGLGFLVMDVKKMIEEDKSLDEIKKFVENYYKKVHIAFSVGDLNYLYKGGRIGKAKTMMGNLLNMKPVLTLKNGKLEPVKSVRGQKKLYKEMVDMVMIDDLEKLEHLKVIHTDSIKISDRIEEELVKKGIDEEDIESTFIDIVIGNHLGPNSGGLITVWRN
ncbi:MAG: DegV family protein [Thermotogota bacterium]